MWISILLGWLPRPAKQLIAVAMVLLMLYAPPVREWVIDRQVSRVERKMDRLMERMEDAPIYGSPTSE
ncbi:MAG: hypothetical protein KTV68_13495 [Acidimicrobiia bacterium]|nr:hypothetical protein [Acidimicrobiia bacterium]MCY4434125.1 hypothetical protein [bacterium]